MRHNMLWKMGIDRKAEEASNQDRISVSTGLAYAMPLVPVLLLVNSFNVVQGIYAKYYGLALTTISAVMFTAGLFDAITDTAIGYWSDRHHARTGSRRSFVVGGMVAAVPCAWFLFVPVTDGLGHVNLTYFIFWYMAFYLAVTFFMIPHMAWARELSANPVERSRAFGFRTFGNYTGLILYYLIPMFPFFATRAITPETIKYSVLLAGVMLLPCLYLFLKRVPSGVPVHETAHVQEHPLKVLRSLAANKPFLIYLAASVFFGIGIGIFYGLLFIVVDSWLGLGEHYVFLFLFHLGVATILIQPAVKLTNRFGKRRTWAVGAGLNICLLPIVLLLLEGGEHSLLLLYLLQFFLGAASAVVNVAMPSLLTDVIDYDMLKSGRDRCATFFSVQSFLSKVTTTTIGYPLGGLIIGYYGFNPANPMHSDDTLFGFGLAMGWLPAGVSVVALLLVFAIPLNRRRRIIVRKRLDVLGGRIKCEEKRRSG